MQAASKKLEGEVCFVVFVCNFCFRYYVTMLSFVDKDQLEPNCSVLLHNKVMSVVGILADDADPLVSVMKVEKAPLESYADIGGLEKQIQEIKGFVKPSVLWCFVLMFSSLNRGRGTAFDASRAVHGAGNSSTKGSDFVRKKERCFCLSYFVAQDMVSLERERPCLPRLSPTRQVQRFCVSWDQS